ncbi:riboflavin biosynthesis protein RibF [bacterium]|nr:riboflavin biosynthesis protein RibF [bacterium]
MEIVSNLSNLPKGSSLILGFFDGIHLGHQEVIKNSAKNPRILITFSNSPAEYFKRDYNYIYTRTDNYKLLESFGIDFLVEQNFAEIASLSAQEYLDLLVNSLAPKSITTGFNHTFGFNRTGNPDFLKKHATSFKYVCTPPTKINDEIVSSTKIKDFLSNGNIDKANSFLGRNFSIESLVIKGSQIGRTLGFPTANMKYPSKIVKIPYGVYLVKALNKPAIMNFGIRPSTDCLDELIEVHIPNFKADLYNKKLRVEIVSRLRNEIKFNDLEALKTQIEKDVLECLKL